MSRAWLAVAIGVLVVALAVVAAVLLPVRRAEAPAALTSPTAPAPMQAPARTAPVPRPEPAPLVVPVAQVPDAAAAPAPLLAELDRALPGLGVPRPARLVGALAKGDRLTLTFSPEFRSQLSDLSALDELTAALSARALTHGYRHLELRVMDARGRAVPLAELVATPAARRPRPEPIDDGVRR